MFCQKGMEGCHRSRTVVGGVFRIRCDAARKRYGPGSFAFEVLEELKKDETQTDREFAQDIGALFELWQERLREDGADEKCGGPPVSE